MALSSLLPGTPAAMAQAGATDRNGKVVASFASKVEPDSPSLVTAIEKAL